MNHSVNLLTKRQTYKHKERLFQIYRTLTVLLGGLCVGALVVVFYLKTASQLTNRSLLSKKEEYLTELLTKKGIEKKVVYFNEKSIVFDRLLKSDVNFLAYYRLLQSRLPLATESAALADVSYHNNGDVAFTLNFGNYTSFYNTINDLEAENFLHIFEQLTLDSVPTFEKEGAGYKVSFTGKLKPTSNEATN